MTLSSPRRLSTPLALFADARHATLGLDDDDPSRDDLVAFVRYIEARDAVLTQLAVPTTSYNAERFYDVAAGDEPLTTFLQGVDHYFPDAVCDDEAIFLSAMATYFAWRGVTDMDTRLYDIEAFLGAPHHPHNRAAVAAWLDDDVDWVTMRSALRRAPRGLRAAVS